MTWLNYPDALAQIQSAGIIAESARSIVGGAMCGDLYIDTAKPVRCLVEDGGRERHGWYWLSTFDIRGQQYITGSFGVYHANDPGKRNIELRLDGKAIERTKEERAAERKRNAERHRAALAAARAEAQRAADRARHVWQRYLPTGRSKYLEKKGVRAHGLRFDPNGAGTCVVPMLRDGGIVGLQILRGRARPGKLQKEYFPAGMDKRGAHHLLGRLADAAVVCIAEGYATAATIFEALGEQVPVAVAFDAGNLMPVAEAIRRANRRAHIVVCADDDAIQRCRAPLAADGAEAAAAGKAGARCDRYTHVALPLCQHCGQPHQATNPGVEAARLAAHAVGGSWIKPDWGGYERD